MTDSDTVEALTDLGLSTYEARVFVALVRLGSGTAREVANIAEVPRSQVYAATQELKERGFISIQQSNPQEFRPVSLTEVKRQLERKFKTKRDTVFEHLSLVEQQAESSPPDDSENMYSMTGSDAISERILQFVSEAEEEVYYSAATLDDPEPSLLDEFQACCNRDVSVTLLREPDQQLPEEWEGIDCLVDYQLPQQQRENEHTERILIVDMDVFLLSIGRTAPNDEVAIWSVRTPFAAAFSQLLLRGFPNLTSSTE